MSKEQYESSVKQMPYSQSCVFAKLSDLSNMAVIKEKLDSPEMRSVLESKVPADKLAQLTERVKEMTFDKDSVTCNISPLGDISLRIIDRDEPKCIKYETVNSPIPFILWIQMLPVTETTSKMKLTVGADLNPFIKGMVAKPLREGVEKPADMLAMIPYGA